MKISDMKTYVVDAGQRNWVFVKLFTDEGLTGVGESTLARYEQMVVGALEGIKTYLIGKNPFNIEHHWGNLYRVSNRRDLTIAAALGGVEQAMWDIVGKACNTPVYNLLGGRCRDRVRCYCHIGGAAMAPPRTVRPPSCPTTARSRSTGRPTLPRSPRRPRSGASASAPSPSRSGS